MARIAEHEAGPAGLLDEIPTIEEVLHDHAAALGRDFVPYRNHVYRVVNLCWRLTEGRGVELEKLAVAAVFHDLGIWTDRTFDYLAPSVRLARDHLVARERLDWIPEVEAAIEHHHKISASRTAGLALVEPFRRADWIDVSRGVRTFGVPRAFIARVSATWPSAGFHGRLVTLTLQRLRTHPFSPLPMVRL